MHSENKWKSIRVAILAKHGGFLRWHADLAEGFSQIGAHVCSINLRPSGFHEVREKIKTSCSTFNNQAIQHRVAAQLKAAKPDLVIMMNRPGLANAAHELWRTVIPRKSLIVGWLCDSWEEIPASDAPNFDILFYFDSASRSPMARAYQDVSKLHHLPLAVNPARYPCHALPAKNRDPHLVFAGNCSANRKKFFHSLGAVGENVEIYGPKSNDLSRFWRNRCYGSTALSRLYGKYLGTLNILQATNTVNGLNLRAFEAPCAGGVGLYPDVKDLRLSFEPGKEILTYRTVNEIAEIMARLRKDPDKADAVYLAGSKRVLAEHTYRNRAAQILEKAFG
jgi:spore maturation protein CgeB